MRGGPDRGQKLKVLAEGYLTIHETSGDIIRIVTDAAASAPMAADFLKTANDRHHQALLEIAAQLR